MQVKQITLQQLTDLIEQSAITSTTNHAGMLTYTMEHQEIGKIITIQASGDGAILIVESDLFMMEL